MRERRGRQSLLIVFNIPSHYPRFPPQTWGIVDFHIQQVHILFALRDKGLEKVIAGLKTRSWNTDWFLPLIAPN
jgi:hypothetical protein